MAKAPSEKTIAKLQEIIAQARSLESSLGHYGHAEGEKIARRAAALRDKAQVIINRFPQPARSNWTRENGRQP